MITIDEKAGVVHILDDSGAIERSIPLADPEAFEIVSRHWIRATWDAKYVYSFAWLGRPVIQLPDDLVRIQELIFEVKPDVIIETGIAHGGSLVFHASLLKAMGKGRVIGIDIDIRAHNRRAIEEHFLADLITLVEADSVAPATIETVRSLVEPSETVLVILDSLHTKAHVLRELELYGPLVSPGSYILATDGVMEIVAGGPRTGDDWPWNNPRQAALDFVRDNAEFELVGMTPRTFNEGTTDSWVSYFPDGLIRRKRITTEA